MGIRRCKPVIARVRTILKHEFALFHLIELNIDDPLLFGGMVPPLLGYHLDRGAKVGLLHGRGEHLHRVFVSDLSDDLSGLESAVVTLLAVRDVRLSLTWLYHLVAHVIALGWM